MLLPQELYTFGLILSLDRWTYLMISFQTGGPKNIGSGKEEVLHAGHKVIFHYLLDDLADWVLG